MSAILANDSKHPSIWVSRSSRSNILMPSNDGVLFNHHADLPKAERFKRCLNHDSPDSCRANRKLLDKRLTGRLTRSMVDRPGSILITYCFSFSIRELVRKNMATSRRIRKAVNAEEIQKDCQLRVTTPPTARVK